MLKMLLIYLTMFLSLSCRLKSSQNLKQLDTQRPIAQIDPVSDCAAVKPYIEYRAKIYKNKEKFEMIKEQVKKNIWTIYADKLGMTLEDVGRLLLDPAKTVDNRSFFSTALEVLAGLFYLGVLKDRGEAMLSIIRGQAEIEFEINKQPFDVKTPSGHKSEKLGQIKNAVIAQLKRIYSPTFVTNTSAPSELHPVKILFNYAFASDVAREYYRKEFLPLQENIIFICVPPDIIERAFFLEELL